MHIYLYIKQADKFAIPASAFCESILKSSFDFGIEVGGITPHVCTLQDS